nr:hypothetical protein Iba_chr05cCG10440 [Ipomoea batatas]
MTTDEPYYRRRVTPSESHEYFVSPSPPTIIIHASRSAHEKGRGNHLCLTFIAAPLLPEEAHPDVCLRSPGEEEPVTACRRRREAATEDDRELLAETEKGAPLNRAAACTAQPSFLRRSALACRETEEPGHIAKRTPERWSMSLLCPFCLSRKEGMTTDEPYYRRRVTPSESHEYFVSPSPPTIRIHASRSAHEKGRGNHLCLTFIAAPLLPEEAHPDVCLRSPGEEEPVTACRRRREAATEDDRELLAEVHPCRERSTAGEEEPLIPTATAAADRAEGDDGDARAAGGLRLHALTESSVPSTSPLSCTAGRRTGMKPAIACSACYCRHGRYRRTSPPPSAYIGRRGTHR